MLIHTLDSKMFLRMQLVVAPLPKDGAFVHEVITVIFVPPFLDVPPSPTEKKTKTSKQLIQ